jgi:hypothetical protein
MKTKEGYGTSYTVTEARKVANDQKMDTYHKELILWLCDRVEKADKYIRELEISRQKDMEAECANWSELP